MLLLHPIRRCFAAALFTCAVSAQVSYYSVSLDAAQEVPPNASAGGGFGIVRVDAATSTVRIFANYFGLSGAPTAAHMHQGAVGINGPIIVPLAAGPGGTFTGNGTLTPAQLATLVANGMYLNVHTAANPGGEIRGQVVLPTSTRFTAVLNAAQEVPPNGSAATGTAVGFLHLPDQRFVYVVDSTGLVNVTAAHVHVAGAGVNGPIVFPLNGTGGTYGGVSPRLTAAQVASLQSGGNYVNIHTTTNPGGEIRGQLLADIGHEFVADLNATNEVPPNASPALGSAMMRIGPTGLAVVVVHYGGLVGTPTASHIHNGGPGVNGPITVPLPAAGSLFIATFTPSAAVLAQIRGGTAYVNVHSTAFPGGEIRGQLRPATLPVTFGPNCPGGSGVRPEAGATGFPSIGNPVGLDLFGVAPGAASFLMFGLDRDSGPGGAPLPIGFPTVGLNAPCFFLLDPLSTQLTFANANGNATLPWGVPFNPGLRGVQVLTQWVSLDAAANPAGMVASNGVSLLVQ